MCCFIAFALSLQLTIALGLNGLSEVVVPAEPGCRLHQRLSNHSTSFSALRAREAAQQVHLAKLRIELHPMPARGRHATRSPYPRTRGEPSHNSWVEGSVCSKTMTDSCNVSRIWRPPYLFSCVSLEVFRQLLKRPHVF